METNWQLIVVAAVVGVAIGHLVRRALTVLRAPGSSSCNSCTSCSDTKAKQVPLVELRDLDKDQAKH